jgi:ubiquinone/menaquinone biosynthesis C-methylase UbiE
MHFIKTYYETPGIPEAYGRHTSLLPSEERILEELRGELIGRTLLDIGVGAGRTTPYLRALAGSYVGIDYSEPMLRLAHANHPDAEFLHCDARRMPFGDGSFDAVFIPYNALDDVDHDDRIAIIGEVHRLLRDDGLLIFSSHNRASSRRSAFRPQRPLWSLDRPVAGNIAALAKYARGIANRLRLVRHERHEKEYALLNDQSYSFGLLAYYITTVSQEAQLARGGFDLTMMVGADGRAIARGEHAIDPWIYYVARRR